MPPTRSLLARQSHLTTGGVAGNFEALRRLISIWWRKIKTNSINSSPPRRHTSNCAEESPYANNLPPGARGGRKAQTLSATFDYRNHWLNNQPTHPPSRRGRVVSSGATSPAVRLVSGGVNSEIPPQLDLCCHPDSCFTGAPPRADSSEFPTSSEV